MELNLFLKFYYKQNVPIEMLTKESKTLVNIKVFDYLMCFNLYPIRIY